MEMDLDNFDFGFTTLSSDSVVDATTAVTDLAAAKSKAEKLYNAILPLLNNLAKDADKNEIIKWPNRGKKIEEFKQHLLAIINS